MVWAEDKSGLSPEEILGLHKGAHVATHNMGSFYMYTHTQDVIQLKPVSLCGGFENRNSYQHTCYADHLKQASTVVMCFCT